MIISTRKITLEEFLELPEEDLNYELIDGEAIPKIASKRFHSDLTIALCILLRSWIKNKGQIGIEWAVILKRNSQDWVPIPDLLYISYDRLPLEELKDEACPFPPELAIEIISPSQSFGSLSQKATDYLQAGVARVWLVDSQDFSVTVFYPDKPPETKRGEDNLADNIVPELDLTVEQIFREAGLV